ncbi:YjbF family lipoprotein [Paracoccus bogoriensis]|uniref:YjbF family lipoprotein n=1 Tax=Paracoccus bogoriensis TaxID=242065 RepID=UPI001C67A445|nr:YjbF family lipoprotein [Paracoccus bogoriensis]MBW7056422.1 YjbF family lipoprotein [Paracoccus bogoriensis]
MILKPMKALTALALLGALAACGNEGPGVVTRTAQAVLADRVARAQGAPETTAPARSDAERAAEALRVNPGPLIQVGFETLGQTQIMAMVGQNGAMRTYMTPSEEAVILRGGMLVGTRGLGRDLSVAEPGTEALIRAGRAGQGTRIMRYLSGDGLERPLQFACTVAPGPQTGLMTEDCEGHGTRFQNTYALEGGQILASRQWVGPGLGHVTIATLRP